MEANNNDLSLRGNNLTWQNRYAQRFGFATQHVKGLWVTRDEGKN